MQENETQDGDQTAADQLNEVIFGLYDHSRLHLIYHVQDTLEFEELEEGEGFDQDLDDHFDDGDGDGNGDGNDDGHNHNDDDEVDGDGDCNGDCNGDAGLNDTEMDGVNNPSANLTVEDSRTDLAEQATMDLLHIPVRARMIKIGCPACNFLSPNVVQAETHSNESIVGTTTRNGIRLRGYPDKATHLVCQPISNQ